jgi:hypothetical protein
MQSNPFSYSCSGTSHPTAVCATSSLPTAAITTDYDTLMQVFPTQALVADAQKKLDELLAKGEAIDAATQQIYDTLLQQSSSSTPGRAAVAALQADKAIPKASGQWNDSEPLQPIDIQALIAKIDRDSLQTVTERRIEFRTTDGFPCLVLAKVDYSKVVPGGSKCKQRHRRQLRQQASQHDVDNAAEQQQVLQHQGHRLHELHLADAAARITTAATASIHADHGQQVQAHSSSTRTLLQSSQCATPKGNVLVLAPFFAENSCAFGDESAEIAALFRAAGYRVTLKCNDHTLCPGGPPSLDDYTGWSQYAFVAVSTVGDADASGESAIILARAPTDFSEERMQDWQAGRMVLTGDGLFALR